MKNVNIRTEKAIPECPLCGKKFNKVAEFHEAKLHNFYVCNSCTVKIHVDDPFVGKWVTDVNSVAEDTKDYVDLLEVPVCPMCKSNMNTFARIDDYFKAQCTTFLCKAQIESTGIFPMNEYLARIEYHRIKKMDNILIDQAEILNIDKEG